MMGANFGSTAVTPSTTMACMVGAIGRLPGIFAVDGTLEDLKCLSAVAMLVCISGIEVQTPHNDGISCVQVAGGPLPIAPSTGMVFSGKTLSISVKEGNARI
jgi:hypothetical protein